MYQKFILLLTAFVFTHLHTPAQNNAAGLFKRCPVKTINYEQGLLNNGTTNIITDASGFTWISTKTGMQRYNGYVLETISPVINKETISINSPVYFFALHNGLIWISCKQGILEYDPHANSFRRIISLPNPKNLNFLIIPVAETTEGIWCMVKNKGFFIYSHEGAVLKKLSADENPFTEHIFSQQEILSSASFAINQHSIFIYNGKDEIQEINLQTHQISYIKANDIYSLTCSNSNLYIISNQELTSININDGKTLKKISFKNIISENTNSASILLSDNQLIVGLNSHLYEFDTACNYLREFTNLNRNPVVSLGFIRTIYADRFKRIWLLTNDDIKRLQNVDIPFEHFIYTNEKNNFVRSLYYDEKQHVLLAGCFNGGIQLYDTSGNALWAKPVITDEVKDIIGIEKLTDHDFLLITLGKGWYILNLESKHLYPLKIPSSLEVSLKSHYVNYANNLRRIDDSTIVIATFFNVFRCVFKDEKLQLAQPLLPFVSELTNSINCFIYSEDKTLWAGTAGGMLYRVDKNKKMQIINLPGNYLVRSLAEDGLHNIWAGTDKGLYVYNISGALIKNVTVQTGLLNDCIYALLPVDNSRAFFASSNLGLSYVSLNGDIINYTKESGLQENEFNTQSAVKTLSGKFYFGGVNGITSFYPASLSNIKDTPVLNITKLLINDSSYNSSLLLQKNFMQLNYSENHIQFDFAATGLLNTNEYKYRYRLNGFEKNWQTTHQPTGIKYILEPGKYLFEITCSPVLSPNSTYTKTISILITPPYWQTWWFRILMIAIFIGIIAFIVQQYLHRQYQRKFRTLQLQHEIQHERERISRDLHDNLGAYAAAIASNVAAIKSSYNGNSENVLNKLQSNSQSIISQLNDTIWALNKEAISLTAVSDRFKVFLQKIQSNYPDINIAIEENISNDEKLSPANALHLFRIMQEAVNNALRHSKGENIFIKINSSDTWNVIIKDDGKGLADLNEKFIAGNGLRNIQLRSEEAGWNAEWKTGVPNGTELVISS